MRLDPKQTYVEILTALAFAAAAWLACISALAAGPAESRVQQKKPGPTGQQYQIEVGDSLSEIAVRHGVSINELMQVNELEDPDKISAGTRLIIPVTSKNGVLTRNGVRIIVPKGITLSRIAELYDIPWKKIARANRLTNPDMLSEGQRLLIPGAKVVVELVPPPPCFKEPVVLYRVHNGDSARVPLCYCDGRPNSTAVETLSRLSGPLARPAPFPLHPRLVQLLQRVANKFPGKRIEIISGQRRGKTKVRESYHGKGQALDFRVAGVSNLKLTRFVRTFHNVGVGYYPNSVFIHMDARDRNAYWIDYSRPGEKAIYGRAGMTKTEIEAIRKKRRTVVTQQAAIEAQSDAEQIVEAVTKTVEKAARALTDESNTSEEKPATDPDEVPSIDSGKPSPTA